MQRHHSSRKYLRVSTKTIYRRRRQKEEKEPRQQEKQEGIWPRHPSNNSRQTPLEHDLESRHGRPRDNDVRRQLHQFCLQVSSFEIFWFKI